MNQVRWPKGPHTLKTCIKLNQKIRLLTTNVQRVDNQVNKWITYYASRFIYKTIKYEWLIITRKILAIQLINTYIGWQLSGIRQNNNPESDIQAQVQNRKEVEPEQIMAKELILNDE